MILEINSALLILRSIRESPVRLKGYWQLTPTPVLTKVVGSLSSVGDTVRDALGGSSDGPHDTPSGRNQVAL